jgi:PAS domain S-box-containing protein
VIRPETSSTLDAARLQQALMGLNVGLWDWADAGAIQWWWSPHFYALLGYTEEELFADLVSLEELLHPGFQTVLFAALERTWGAKEGFDVEVQLRTQHAGYRWFRCQARVLLDAQGDPQHVAGTLEDIHERKIEQQQAGENSDQLRSIFSWSDDGFVAFGSDGNVKFCSPAFYRMTGAPQGGLIALDERQFLRQLPQWLHLREDVCNLDDLVKASPHSAEVAPEFGNRAVIATLHTPSRMLEWRLHRGQGRVTQMLHVRDVTHEIEVERMKSEFLSIASHELRTPMTSIFGFVSLLLHQPLPPERQRTMLARVYRQCESMINIINELLDLARIEAKGATEFEFEHVDLCALLDDVVADYKLPEGRQAPEVTMPSEPAMVVVDAHKTKQALLNLLSNAYKYSPNGGPVTVSFSKERVGQDTLQFIRFSDRGLGMSPEHVKRFGERFFRANSSGNIQGTGLGISIVREIVEHMGGSMAVDSELGVGTTVTLTLRPVAVQQPA